MWFVSNGISFLQPSIYLLRLFRHEDGSVYIFMDLMFIKLDLLKKWRVALVLEETRARTLDSQCGDQHFASLEGLRLTKRETVDSLATLRAENKKRLQQLDKNFQEMKDLSEKCKQKDDELLKLNSKFTQMEFQVEEARKEAANSKEVCIQSVTLGEQSIKGGIELAFE
ncbi:uncharacterized protein [Spinacia oleracea]|uniref:Uncharacterized protein isoform X2 n=1 Tax=Spinacia oleracea TaxID=3562 RepID=A0ABM3QKV5_SPIOL|nr:uncharacterized protein LOC110776954 isoform X2 [Spinacia oleracea]